MPIYQGVLKRIGNGQWVNKTTTFSVLEIGDHALREVKCSDFLKNYLEDSLGQPTAIGVVGDEILAVKTASGVYEDNSYDSPLPALLGVVVGIVTTPVIVGFVILARALRFLLIIRPGFKKAVSELRSLSLPEAAG